MTSSVAMKCINNSYRCVCRKTQYVDRIFADGSCGQSTRSRYLKFDLAERGCAFSCVIALPVAVFVKITIQKPKFVSIFVSMDKSVVIANMWSFVCYLFTWGISSRQCDLLVRLLVHGNGISSVSCFPMKRVSWACSDSKCASISENRSGNDRHMMRGYVTISHGHY